MLHSRSCATGRRVLHCRLPALGNACAGLQMHTAYLPILDTKPGTERWLVACLPRVCGCRAAEGRSTVQRICAWRMPKPGTAPPASAPLDAGSVWQASGAQAFCSAGGLVSTRWRFCAVCDAPVASTVCLGARQRACGLGPGRAHPRQVLGMLNEEGGEGGSEPALLCRARSLACACGCKGLHPCN